MRSTIRGVLALGSLAGLLTAAVTFFPSAPSAGGGPTTRLDDYALFASDLLRTRGLLSVDGLAVGVNRGSLLTHGPLDANDQDVVVGGSNGLVRLRSGSDCGTLFAFPAKVIGTNCSSSAVMSFVGPIVDNVPAACGFPVTFPSCGGSDVTVGHDQSLTLAGGSTSNPTRRGKVLLRGGGPGAGSLTLTGGTYVFCSLRVGRGASLFVGSAAQVFVAGDVQLFPDSIVGPTNPAASSALGAFVNGDRVRISRRSRFTGRVCAPNALLALGSKSQVFGTLVARVISADRNASVQGIPVAPPTTTTLPPATTTTTLPPATTTTTLPPATTTTTLPPATTTTTLPPATTTTTLPPATTTTTLPPATTTTTLPPATTTTTLPPATTTTTLPPATTTTTLPPATTTTTLPPATTTTTAPPPPTTTTTIPSGANTFRITIRPGTTSCGGAAFNPPAAAPTGGELRNSAGTKIPNSDLGKGCLYFGGGSNQSVPGGAIPTGADSYFAITGRNGTVLTLGPSAGTGRTNCSLPGGPGLACVDNVNFGKTCTTDADCSNFALACQPVGHCFFGAPLPIPNPNNPALSTCVVNVFNVNPVSGTADTAANGATNITVPLSSRVYLTGNLTAPCPTCSAAVNGTCSRGPDAGKTCQAVSAGVTSVDCRPDGTFQAPLGITFAPLTTGQSTKVEPTANTGRICPGQTVPKRGAFGFLGGTATTGVDPTRPAQVVENGAPPTVAIPQSPASARMELGSSFCIGSVGPTIDPVAGLPGPGALNLIVDAATTTLP